MKKAITLLLALALIGGAAFAQDEAVEGKAPVVTAGLSGAFGYNAIQENTVDTFDDAFKPVGKGIYAIGGDEMKVEAWVQAVYDTLTFKFRTGYAVSDSNGGYSVDDAARRLFQLTTTWAPIEGVSLISAATYNDNAYLDPYWATLAYSNGFFHDLTAKISKDKVSGEIVWRNTTAPATGDTFLGYGYSTFINSKIRNAWWQVADMFDVWTVKAGDMRGRKVLRFGSLNDDMVFASNSTIGRFRTTGWLDVAAAATGASDATQATKGGIDLFHTFKLGNALEFLPLTLYVGNVVPTSDMSFVDWLAGNYQFYGAKFDLADIGSLDAGVALSLDYSMVPSQFTKMTAHGAKWITDYTFATTTTNYANPTSDDSVEAIADAPFKLVSTSAYWADFSLKMPALEALQLLVGFDMQNYAYADRDQFIADLVAGKGVSATNPITLATLNTSVMNIGVEAIYDLKDIVEGLKVTAFGYVASAGAYDYEAVTGNTFAEYTATLPTAANYLDASYTQANFAMKKVFDVSPLYIHGIVSYALNETVAFKLGGKYTKLADAYEEHSVTGLKDAYGYYDKTVATLGADITAAQGTVSVELGYNMFSGVPAAATLFVDGLTDDQKAAATSAYSDFISEKYNPFYVFLGYKASF